ncbi:CPK16, partial [Symbiodinium sp. CCMP2456]
TTSEWWDGLVNGPSSHVELIRQRKPSSDEVQATSSEEGHEDEDATKGILNILASVKTSVVAAVLGTGSGRSDEDEDNKDPPVEEEGSEDWWQSAQAALGMADDSDKAESPAAMTEEPEEVSAALPQRQEEEAAEEPLELEAEPVLEAVDVPEDADPQEDEPPPEPLAEVEVLPPPEVPGMEDANLVVSVEIDEKKQKVLKAGEEGAENLMAGSNRQILEAMAQEGWEVEVVNESENLYMLSLPPVLYEVMGSTISIPAPKFLTKLRDTRGTPTSGPYQGRMEGDLVLQNGEGIFTLQLGFPFRSTLSISAAGWTRAQISWKGDEIVATNYVEVGIKLPKVPGLTNIMEYFVKSYGTQSTQDCTDALARAAEVARPPETPLQIVEEKVKELFTPLTGPEPEEAETQPETDAVDPVEVGLTLPSIAEAEPASPEEQASSEDPLPPVVPGMEEANLVVRVKIDPKRRRVEDLGAE